MAKEELPKGYKKVRFTMPAYYNGIMYREDDEAVIPADMKGECFEVLIDAKPVPAKKAPAKKAPAKAEAKAEKADKKKEQADDLV